MRALPASDSPVPRYTYFSTLISSFFTTFIVFSLGEGGRGIMKSAFFFFLSQKAYFATNPCWMKMSKEKNILLGFFQENDCFV